MTTATQSEKTPSSHEGAGVVYMYTCKANGKSYIGQTWDIAERQRSHRRAKGEIRLFHQDINKHGYDTFDFFILHEGIEDQNHLDILEWTEIRQRGTLFPNGYNLVEGGIGGTFSEESKKVLSKSVKLRFSDPGQRAAMAEKIRQFHADPVKGLEHKKKIRQAWENNAEYRAHVLEAARKRKTDPVWKAKQEEMLKKRGKSVVCIETGLCYGSMTKAGASCGVTCGAIAACMSGKTKQSGGFHWRFATPEEAQNVKR